MNENGRLPITGTSEQNISDIVFSERNNEVATPSSVVFNSTPTSVYSSSSEVSTPQLIQSSSNLCLPPKQAHFSFPSVSPTPNKKSLKAAVSNFFNPSRPTCRENRPVVNSVNTTQAKEKLTQACSNAYFAANQKFPSTSQHRGFWQIAGGTGAVSLELRCEYLLKLLQVLWVEEEDLFPKKDKKQFCLDIIAMLSAKPVSEEVFELFIEKFSAALEVFKSNVEVATNRPTV